MYLSACLTVHLESARKISFDVCDGGVIVPFGLILREDFALGVVADDLGVYEAA